jgi:hypothetical protein
MDERKLTKGPALRDSVAAISCGIYRGTPVLDLDYLEDVEAHTDANFVMTGTGKFVEIQGTAEQVPFSRDELNSADGAGRTGHWRIDPDAEGGTGMRLARKSARRPAAKPADDVSCGPRRKTALA